jgi:hypothetical protein
MYNNTAVVTQLYALLIEDEMVDYSCGGRTALDSGVIGKYN